MANGWIRTQILCKVETLVTNLGTLKLDSSTPSDNLTTICLTFYNLR